MFLQNLSRLQLTVESSILLTRTIRCLTPAVFASMACSLVWPPFSKPVSNSPFLAEMTWPITDKRKTTFPSNNIENVDENVEVALNFTPSSPRLPSRLATLPQSCLGQSSCVRVHPGWWNVSSPSQSKLSRPPLSSLCPSPPGLCPEPMTGTCKHVHQLIYLHKQPWIKIKSAVFTLLKRCNINNLCWTQESAHHVSLFFSFASLSYFSRVRFSTIPVKYLEEPKTNRPAISEICCDMQQFSPNNQMLKIHTNPHFREIILKRCKWD